MKKTFTLFLSALLLLSCFCFVATAEDTVRTEVGSFDVTRFNDVWGTPSDNVVLVITPGNSMSGLYYNKIYAEYDSAKDCYVIVEKVWNHLPMNTSAGTTRVVASNGIGIAFSYVPLKDTSNVRLREMWLVWQKLRVGDELTFSDLDLSAKTLGTDPKVNFTTVRSINQEKGPYSDLKIVALGDSITVGGGWTEYLGDYLKTEIVNAGMGGDTAAGAYLSRFDMLVPQHEPDIVIISYGINDCLAVGANPTQTAITNYQGRIRSLYQKATALGAKVVFQTANNIDVATYETKYNSAGAYDAFGGVQGYLDLWEQSFRDVAAELNVPMIDLYAKWRSDVAAGEMLMDSVHPNGEGYAMNLEVMKEFWDSNVSLFVKNFLFGSAASTLAAGIKVSDQIASYAAPNTLQVKFAGNVLSADSLVGTGAVIESLDSTGKVVSSTVVVVKGDLGGDGAITPSDYMSLASHLAGNSILEAERLSAADVNGDGQQSSSDYMAIASYINGSSTDFQ